MLNLLVDSEKDAWKSGSHSIPLTRYCEYTVPSLKNRYDYETLSQSLKNELMSIPSLFAVEREEVPTKIGRITEINTRKASLEIKYEIISDIPELETGKLAELKSDLDIDQWEFTRTHWAIKDVNLASILLDHKIIKSEEAHLIPTQPNSDPKEEKGSEYISEQIFIVHGHDAAILNDTSDFVRSVGLVPIVLQEEPGRSLTIIEKLEEYSNVKCAIVLYTPCDIACSSKGLKGLNGEVQFKFRARQNVVFEHGYCIGKLDRKNVFVLKNNDVELPSDILGINTIDLDLKERWKDKMKRELEKAGYNLSDKISSFE